MSDSHENPQPPQASGDGRANNRKLLTDILAASGDRDRVRRQWADTQAAAEFGTPLPRGEYVARIIGGELFSSQSGTPGYKLTFLVIEGEHAGRHLWSDHWLTDTAMQYTKRDLQKIGVTELAQVDNPLPLGIVCSVKLVLRRNDDGSEFNRVKSFEVIRIDPPANDPFAPTPIAPPDGDPSTTTVTTTAEAVVDAASDSNMAQGGAS